MFIDKVVNSTNKKIEKIRKLEQSSLPLVMYGAGSYAIDVNKLLIKQGVKVDAFCVDDEYFQDNLFVDGIKVDKIGTICKRYTNFNMVIGFADYRKARQKMAVVKEIDDLIFIDAPHSLEFLDYNYVINNQKEFETTLNLLEDQRSKDVLIAYLNAKICGLPDGLYEMAQFNPYFNDLIKLTDGEVFVDCGAYDGDTIRAFYKNVNGKYNKIYAFEPDNVNFESLKSYLMNKKIENVCLVNKGCWDRKTTLLFSSDGNMTSQVQNEGSVAIEVDSIDNVVGLNNVTFIKMDIEGSELAALRGCANTIKREKPKLAICVYHKPEDLITIPQYIKNLVPEYRLYLRHHQFISWETVLYATL